MAGVLPETYAFLLRALENGHFEGLDLRRTRLIDSYFATDSTLSDLTLVAEVTTRAGVRQIIVTGLESLWQRLPPELQIQNRKEQILKLKTAHSPETRSKMSEARKGNWQNKKADQNEK